MDTLSWSQCLTLAKLHTCFGFLESDTQGFWTAVGAIAVVLPLLVGFSTWLVRRLIRKNKPPVTQTKEQRDREAMLDKVRAIWITGFLDQSLEKEARITLGLSERSDAVLRSLNLQSRLPHQAPRPLPPNTQMIEVFDTYTGQLLILGAPGAGKTTLLLELTRDLLTRAKQNPQHLIPVVFPLSSWAQQRRPLADWLVDELNQRYDVPRQIAQTWIEQDRILPLLDGLDEVAQSYRGACVEAINRFQQDERGLLPLVVCCRVADYEAIGNTLRLQGAVVVQPLTRAQVNGYLDRIGEPVAGIRHALHTDATLWELLDTPLLLSIMTLAYGGQPVAALQAEGGIEVRRQHLFAAYIDQMFRRRNPTTRYKREQTLHWLAWLARQMVQRSQTVFYIERLQPDWLPDSWKRRWGLGLLVTLCSGLLGVLVFWQAVGLAVGLLIMQGFYLVIGLVVGLPAGLVIGLSDGLNKNIIPAETVRWSFSTLRHVGILGTLFGALRFGLRSGLVLGLVLGLVFVWLGGRGSGTTPVWELLLNGLLGGLLFFVPIGALEFILRSGLSFGEIETKTVPNQGIRRSARNALVFGLCYGLGTGGLFTWLFVGWLVFAKDGGLFFGLFVGSFFGLSGALASGGDACLRHFALRFLLVRNGSAPWNYPAFLDVAAEYLFLRKVGGGYIFVHRMLLEYFAELPEVGKRQ